MQNRIPNEFQVIISTQVYEILSQPLYNISSGDFKNGGESNTECLLIETFHKRFLKLFSVVAFNLNYIIFIILLACYE